MLIIFNLLMALLLTLTPSPASIAEIPPAPLQVVMVDGNDDVIGTVLNMEFTTFGVISDKNYAYLNVTFLNGRTNTQRYVWYTSFDCTGKPYTDLPNGMVFDAYPSTDSRLYYVHRQAIPVEIQTHSRSDATQCTTTTTVAYRYLHEALQNDPSVTGIPNSDYPSPITIDRR